MMTGGALRKLALIAGLASVSCGGSSILSPLDPDEVLVTMRVSGGIAGVSYAIVVDGSGREVRGRPCFPDCGVQPAPADDLFPISVAQVSALAELLDESGILALDGTDFGTQCCDQFHIDLTYERGSRSATVQGTDALLPEGLRAAMAYVMALASRNVPTLVAPDSRDTDWPRDPYTLGSVTVEGRTLTAQVTYGGGCAAHRMDLVAWGGWLESFPVQIHALITHDDEDDPCDAVVTDARRFELSPLARAYEDAYGPIGTQRPTVILRLWDPMSGSPVGRLIEIVL